MDSFGRLQPRRQYVSDPTRACRGSRGGAGGDAGGERLRHRPRSATTAATDTDDEDDGDNQQYIFRQRQRRPSRRSLRDDVSVLSDDAVMVDVAQHGVALSARVADGPVTLPGVHLGRTYVTSSVSSGTGN